MKEIKKEEEQEEKKELNKVKKLLVKLLKTKTGRIVLGVIVLLIIITIASTISSIKSNKELEEFNQEYLYSTIKKAKELTTAELNYKGTYRFKDSGIRIINKSDFLMVYTAKVRVGIDVKKIEVDSNPYIKVVTITIPKAKVLSVNVDPSKIKYYDEKFSLFNFDAKEDSDKAQAEIEKKAKEEISNLGVLAMADKQAETLITGLIKDAVPRDYKIEVKSKESK